MNDNEALRYSYNYRDFAVFIRPSKFAEYGHPQWRADRATPLSWGYRIDKIPGKANIASGEWHESREAAETAVEQQIQLLEWEA